MRDFFVGVSYALMMFAGACVVMFALTGLFPLKPIKSDAMKVCELSHSHEVCFSTLNR